MMITMVVRWRQAKEKSAVIFDTFDVKNGHGRGSSDCTDGNLNGHGGREDGQMRRG